MMDRPTSGRRFGRRIASLTTAVAALAALAGACSLPVDEVVVPIDRDQFGEQLTRDTTTTTTTVVPPDEVTDSTSDGTDPEATTTTTVAPIPTEPISVYYTRGDTEIMQEVVYERAQDTPIEEVISLLESRTGLAQAGLRTAVRPGLIEDRPVVDRAVATVSLSGDVVDGMPNEELERAIAQIVLTLTSFRTPDASNIGGVRFEVDGSAFPIFVPARGGASDPGEAVVFTDFVGLIATSPDVTTTTEPAPDPADSSTTTEPE